MRLLALAGLLVLLALAGCGGSEEATTVTVTTTVAPEPELEDDRAYQLAFDFCRNAPLETVALLQGGDPEQMAREFSSRIRPELREEALAGCLAARNEDD